MLEQVAAVAPAGLAVVHLKHFKHVAVFLRSLLLGGEDKVVLRGADGIAAVGHTAGPARALPRGGIDEVERAAVGQLLLFYICARARHPAHGLREGAHQLGALLREAQQLVVPTALAAAQGGLIAHADVLPVGREAHAAHASAVGEVVNHVGMGFLQRGADGSRGVDADADAVGVAGLGQVLDGNGVVLGRQLQLAAGLLAVDKELIVLGAFHLDLAFHKVSVVHVETEQAYALLLLQRGQQTRLYGGLALLSGLAADALQQRGLVELLAVDADAVGSKGSNDAKGAVQVELAHRGLHLCLQPSRNSQGGKHGR